MFVNFTKTKIKIYLKKGYLSIAFGLNVLSWQHSYIFLKESRYGVK